MGKYYTKKLSLKNKNVEKSSKPQLLGVLSTPHGPQSTLKQVLPVFEQYVEKPTFLGKKNITFPKKNSHARHLAYKNSTENYHIPINSTPIVDY